MSSLFSNSTNPSFREFARTTNPQDAQAKVQHMVSTGQVSQQQVNRAIDQAKRICEVLGVK